MEKMSFRQALLALLESDEKISLRSLATKAGVSYDQLKKLKSGKSESTNVDDAIRIAGALGLTVNEFVRDPVAALRDDVARQYSQLSDEERAFLRKISAAEAAAAQAAGPQSPSTPDAGEEDQ